MRFFCAYHGVAAALRPAGAPGPGREARAPSTCELSTGQQRRLALALAVAHNPPVLFLDEPTAGLDVASRAELHALMRELQDGGTTIILATHDMAEAEKMADRVAILLQGKIVATGTPLEITATGAGLTKISVRTENDCLASHGVRLPGRQPAALKDDYAIYYSTDPGPTVSAILDLHQAPGRQADRPARGAPLAGRTLPGDHQHGRCTMNAFANHFAFEFRTGLRNKTLLLMNYLFPLGFYLMMGFSWPQINPPFRETMIPAMVDLRRHGRHPAGPARPAGRRPRGGHLPQLQDQRRAGALDPGHPGPDHQLPRRSSCGHHHRHRAPLFVGAAAGQLGDFVLVFAADGLRLRRRWAC